MGKWDGIIFAFGNLREMQTWKHKVKIVRDNWDIPSYFILHFKKKVENNAVLKFCNDYLRGLHAPAWDCLWLLQRWQRTSVLSQCCCHYFDFEEIVATVQEEKAASLCKLLIPWISTVFFFFFKWIRIHLSIFSQIFNYIVKYPV